MSRRPMTPGWLAKLTTKARSEPGPAEVPEPPFSASLQCSGVPGLACLPPDLYCMAPGKPLTVIQTLGTHFCRHQFCS